MAAGCAPAKPKVVVPEPVEKEATFERVDAWQHVDLARPSTIVEQQLKRSFEKAFASAQYSKAYTCLARERASFFERYRGYPNEELEQTMLGRCGVGVVGKSTRRTYFSDGTLLDGPLSDETLADIVQKLPQGLPAFTVFGVSARYDGPNALLWLETATPNATMYVGEPDEERDVRVHGEVLGEFSQASAVINQGAVGVADCEPDYTEPWPKYAFTCPMALGDDEAWISLLATSVGAVSETVLVDLPAHATGWTPPREYHRHSVALPDAVDARSALFTSINAMRQKAGSPALRLAEEESRRIQAIYHQQFVRNAAGDWTNLRFLLDALRGERIGAAVSWGRLANGIAFDGDASDWLAYQLMLPTPRATLMTEMVDEIAIATDGDPGVGFAAAAAVYQLLTPERERELAERVSADLVKARRGNATERLVNPPELEDIAREVASGAKPLEALSTALLSVKLELDSGERLTCIFLPLYARKPDFKLVAPLLAAERLRYGVVITHVTEPSYGWANPTAMVWFVTEQPLPRTAALSVPNH